MKFDFQANHEGAMLALFAPSDVASRIAIPGGEPAEELHITLFYFYDNADLGDDNRNRILQLASKLAAEYTGLDVVLQGTEVFEENEERPLVAIVRSPMLEDFRGRLAAVLDDAGIEYSKDYEYKPHLTLKYLEDGPRPDVTVEECFVVNKVEARFADKRVPIYFGNHFVRRPPRPGHYARPKAGQIQRRGSASWEDATNRQQKKLVQVYDTWAAELKRGLRQRADRGATVPELSAYLDGQIPFLEKRLTEIQAAGILGAVKVSAKSRADLPQIRAISDRLIAENVEMIRQNLIPRIHEKVTLALATGAVVTAGTLNAALNTTRAMPAAYSGGYWVAIFEVQKGLGQVREDERKAQGQEIEPIRWVLDPLAEHCQASAGYFGCPEMAGEYPGGWSTLKTVPAGQVTCRGNCRCHIEVKRDGQWQRGVFRD